MTILTPEAEMGVLNHKSRNADSLHILDEAEFLP